MRTLCIALEDFPGQCGKCGSHHLRLTRHYASEDACEKHDELPLEEDEE